MAKGTLKLKRIMSIRTIMINKVSYEYCGGLLPCNHIHALVLCIKKKNTL
jgi:hypothetical protein